MMLSSNNCKISEGDRVWVRSLGDPYNGKSGTVVSVSISRDFCLVEFGPWLEGGDHEFFLASELEVDDFQDKFHGGPSE